MTALRPMPNTPAAVDAVTDIAANLAAYAEAARGAYAVSTTLVLVSLTAGAMPSHRQAEIGGCAAVGGRCGGAKRDALQIAGQGLGRGCGNFIIARHADRR